MFIWLLIFLFCVDVPIEARRRSRKKKITTQAPIKIPPKKIASHSPLLTESTIKKAIDRLVKNNENKAAIGVHIFSLAKGQTYYEKNADQLFTPASNTKVVTGAAAFHFLGPLFTFSTQLLTEKQTGSTLNTLYLKGSGDPSLKTKHLEELILMLKARGIKEIKGNLVIDATIFDMVPQAPGWSKGDGPIFDKSPAGGLVVNHSCISIIVKPSRMVGRPPVVILDPVHALIHIENKARTSVSKSLLHVSRKKDNTIVVTGVIAKGSKQKQYRIALAQPHLYAGHLFLGLLKKHNIQFRGKLICAQTPKTATVIADHQSAALHILVHHLMKKSDNLYADALFKRIGARVFGTPGTWNSGQKAIDMFLKKQVGINTEHIKFFDGSGLSHSNKISPRNLTQLLQWIYEKSSFKAYFLNSLPISGVDGSLKRRMVTKVARSKIKAKTGNLTGVTSLSGYITKPEPVLVFASMVNKKNKSVRIFKRTLEDAVCTLLASYAH